MAGLGHAGSGAFDEQDGEYRTNGVDTPTLGIGGVGLDETTGASGSATAETSAATGFGGTWDLVTVAPGAGTDGGTAAGAGTTSLFACGCPLCGGDHGGANHEQLVQTAWTGGGTGAPEYSAAGPSGGIPTSSFGLMGRADVDSLTYGVKWGGAQGTGVTLTYSFATTNAYYKPGYHNNTPWDGFGVFSESQKANARLALEEWSKVANITFVEVTDSATQVGDIRFAKSTDASLTAFAYFPTSVAEGGDIWFGYNADLNDTAPGTYGYATLLHEIGHALGLAHPHQATGISQPIAAGEDWHGNSVMSYRSYPNAQFGYSQDRFAATPMFADIAAIQYIYGANTNHNATDTVYAWAVDEAILETLWDAGGVDTIDWSNQASAAKIDLRAGAWSELGPAWQTDAFFHIVESRTLRIADGVAIENAKGGAGADTITGNDAANLLEGGAGNDTLNGGIGNDTLIGGAGTDRLDGGAGNDTYVIGDSLDTIVETADGGTDTIQNGVGGTLGDHIENMIVTTTGAVVINGNGLANILTGGAGNDAINGGDGNDTLNGGAGNDTLTGGAGADSLAGGTGDDLYVIDGADSVIELANQGIDTVRAQMSHSLASGVEILDLLGSAAVDGTGNALDNTLRGNVGANTLSGLDGNDLITAGDGNDVLLGGAGNDTLDGGTGADQLSGGMGDDTLVYSSEGTWAVNFIALNTDTGESRSILGLNRSYDIYDGGAGYDRLVGTAGNDAVFLDDGANPFPGAPAARIAGIEEIDLGDGDDVLDMTSHIYQEFAAIRAIGGNGSDVLWLSEGNDTILGGAGNDTIFGGLGNDEIRGGSGANSLTGGGGRDRFVFESADGAPDIIRDFATGAGGDYLVLTELLAALGYSGPVSLATGPVHAVQSGSHTDIVVDLVGGGTSIVATLHNLAAGSLVSDNWIL